MEVFSVLVLDDGGYIDSMIFRTKKAAQRWANKMWLFYDRRYMVHVIPGCIGSAWEN